MFGQEQQKLVEKIVEEKPDLIVFTGDLIDYRKYDEIPSLTLMEKLVKIAPTYYVTGNHEWNSGKYDSLEQELLDIGVGVLRNQTVEIKRGHEHIFLSGVDDPAFEKNTEDTQLMEKFLTGVDMQSDTFHILLSHRPELFSLYADDGFDLVFTGHAHGGQFRLPLIGGLVAPNQGLFPKYTEGEHQMGQTTMIVSRGLGNSIIPVRIFNRPEIVVVTLRSTE